MATQSTDREWANAVIGTGIIASLGAILLGVFQLVDGATIGVVPLFIGGIGAVLLFFLPNWHERLQEMSDRISQYYSPTANDNARSVLRKRYARGDINVAEFDRRLRQLRASDTDEDDSDDSTIDQEQEIILRRN